MKVLIAGISGFLGSNVARHLLSKGFEIHGLVRAGSDLRRINDLDQAIHLHDTSKQDIGEIVRSTKPLLVINTVCNYNRNGESIQEVLNANLLLGVELIEASIKNWVECFINSGTLLDASINEYALSKHQLVQWMKLWSTKMQMINLRIEHMIGAGDDKTKFILWLANAINNPNEFPEIKLTSGVQHRDFVNVKDVASVFSTLITNSGSLGQFEEFDVGSGTLSPVRRLVDLLVSKLDPSDRLDSSRRLKLGALPYRFTDVMKPTLDITPLQKLGWSPKFTLEASVDEVVDSLKQ
jgi:nucleoside-diphosphate-sugar epimerase